MSDIDALLNDLSRTAPFAQVIAQDLVASAKGLNRPFPAAEHLTEAIQDILPESHLKQAPVLKINLLDKDFVLIDGNYFDANADGKLDPLETNYPPGSKYVWRLSTASFNQDGSITLTFINKTADQMMNAKGPYKANRSSSTRAQFIGSVVEKVPGAEFHCEQLDKTEPVDPVVLAATTPSSKTANKTGKKHAKKKVGLGDNFGQQTVQGQPMGPRQAEQANILLGRAHAKNAGEVATVAIIFAGIWESNLEKYADNGTYWGVLSARHDHVPQFDTAAMADAFLNGGKGFTSALELEKTMKNPAAVASHAEGATPFDSQGVSKQYQGEDAWVSTEVALAEAKGIVQAGGGAASGGDLGPGTQVEVVQPYFFQIGTTDNRNESDWDGSVRLAGEVNWEFFLDGPDVYYDSDLTLIKQKITKVIHRTDGIVAGWGPNDWENRNIATAFTLSLYCEPFEYVAGEVFMLKGFGMDNATTAKLPGRWLIADAVRQPGSLVTQFSLVQPTRPKNEPAPQVTETTIGGTGKGKLSVLGLSGGPKTVAAAVAAAQELSAMRVPYYKYARDLHDVPPSKKGLDCSGSTSWVLWKAGFPIPGSPSAAPVSGAYAASWGDPGEGKEMTVWANADHVFIEFKLKQGDFQMNTSYGEANGLGSGSGPQFFKWGQNGEADANGGSFTPRHYPGT